MVPFGMMPTGINPQAIAHAQFLASRRTPPPAPKPPAIVTPSQLPKLIIDKDDDLDKKNVVTPAPPTAEKPSNLNKTEKERGAALSLLDLCTRLGDDEIPVPEQRRKPKKIVIERTPSPKKRSVADDSGGILEHPSTKRLRLATDLNVAVPKLVLQKS